MTADAFCKGKRHGSGTEGLAMVDSASKSVFAMHVTGGADIGGRSAYTMEYAMAAMASQVSLRRGLKEQCWTDCKSVRDGLTYGRAKSRRVGTTHAGGVPRLKWTPSHPENTSKHPTKGWDNRGTWTEQDWGIWIADQVAAGDFTAVRNAGYRVQDLTVTMSEVYDSLTYQGRWIWVDMTTGTPMPANLSLLQHVTRNLPHQYSARREQYASLPGCGSLHGGWADNSLRLAAAVHRLPDVSLSKAARIVRLILDKHFHQGNLAKGAQDEVRGEVSKCVLCGQQDSQDHWLLHCPNNGGDKWRQKATDALASIEGHYDSSPILRWTARYVVSQLQHPQTGRRVWTANWSQDMIIEYTAGLIDPADSKEASRAVIKCSRILSEAMSDIFEERKVFIRSHTYLELCARDPSCRDHDYDGKLQAQREKIAHAYELKLQKKMEAKSTRYAGTFFHPLDVIVAYEELQTQLDKANLVKYKRRTRQMVLSPAQLILNSQAWRTFGSAAVTSYGCRRLHYPFSFRRNSTACSTQLTFEFESLRI